MGRFGRIYIAAIYRPKFAYETTFQIKSSMPKNFGLNKFSEKWLLLGDLKWAISADSIMRPSMGRNQNPRPLF